MDIIQIDRGVMYSHAIGSLAITYLSGKDADERTPIFDMSLGEIYLENKGTRPINLKYDASQTLFSGHHFTFGPYEPGAVADDKRMPHEDPPDPVSYDLAPGQRLLISRRDFMDVVLRSGLGILRNGEVCTQFEASLQVDGVAHALRFGPHCFRVTLERDWKQEEERYVQFFLARDRRI